MDAAVTQQPSPTQTPRMEVAEPAQEGHQADRPSRDESFFSRPPIPVSTPPEESPSQRNSSEIAKSALRPQDEPGRPRQDEGFPSCPALPTSQQGSAQHSPASKPHRDEGFFSRPALPATQQDSSQHSPAAGSKHDDHSGRPDRDERFFSRPALPSSAVADHPMFDNPASREHTSLPKSDPSAATVDMAEDYLSRPAKPPPFNAAAAPSSKVSPRTEQPHRDESFFTRPAKLSPFNAAHSPVASASRASPRSDKPPRDAAFFSRPALSPRRSEQPAKAGSKSERPQRSESFFSRPALPSSAISDHPMFDHTPSGSRTPSPRSGTPRSPGTCHDLAEGYLSRPAKLPPFNSPQPMFPHLNLTSSTDLASVSEYDPDLAHTPRDDSAHNASGMMRMLDLKPHSVPRSQSLKREPGNKGVSKVPKSEMLSHQAHSRTSLLDGQESSAPVKPPSRKLLRTTQW